MNKYDLDEVYKSSISQFPLLTKKEEMELPIRIAQGDETAREKMIHGNLRLVIKISWNYQGLGLSLMDIISEGNIGLMRAVEKYDPTKGAKFSYYASWWIKRAIIRALYRNSRTIRIPIVAAGKISRVTQATRELQDRLDREPVLEEIAKKAEYSIEDVYQILQYGCANTSLNDAMSGEDSPRDDFFVVTENTESPNPFEQTARKQGLDFFSRQIAKLRPDERQIIFDRFGLNSNQDEPMTLREVGKKINRSYESVRRREKDALAKLREFLNEYERCLI